MNEAPHKVDHIGIAVKSLEEHLPFYTQVLGLKHLGTEHVESQHVNVAFLQIGETKLELLEPTRSESAIAAFIDKKGEGVHHVAIGVTDISSRLQELKENGIRTLQDQPVPGAGGAEVAFLHPKSTGRVLYELCEKK
ncbi:methylmalonyl-CoA epimerase [Salsuginibacillus kocurii]|uniref:methylmalonyl-CoA epimerase n=1 Tax=Salsuginibacillus kocurii TaxID=427078 RepID=UPI00037E6369|nr:methylmalonyl-CoA epimerase [Salsuginibacillus kocurii]